MLTRLLALTCILLTASHLGHTYRSLSGCSDGSTEGFQEGKHTAIAACAGQWTGHIENATYLCSDGWQVCGWHDEHLLQTISWEDATTIEGCYAINAAQDGGTCRPCVSDVSQDDLGGVGRSCPHQTYGQTSCISGGQIDVTCCTDTNFRRACSYRPGLATGILCCKRPGVPPQMLVRPQELTHVQTGATFVLSCQAMGTPTPIVTWYKDKDKLPNNISRIAVFDSGYLLISQADPSDTGRYTCVVSNTVANDSAVARIVVTDHSSGCADHTTDGLHRFEDIQACRGEWRGHVKRAKSICAPGWQVCNPRHAPLLKMLTWSDASQLRGCYAYNAANTLNQCTRCHRSDMAGVGNACGRIRRSYKSCLAVGRVDVYRGRRDRGCDFQKGVTDGVLCCRKPKKNSRLWEKAPRCQPRCANGGICEAHNRCRCAKGYKGAWCQNPICPGGCIPNSTCTKPGVCQCKLGYTGKKCRKRQPQCRKPCQHGGRCKAGKCKCIDSYWGPYCQYEFKQRPLQESNRTER